jgi:hypothetical protein
VREAARQDGDYEALRRKVQTDDNANPNPDDCVNSNPDDRGNSNPYTIEDGVLYYKHCLVVPQSMRETVLKAEHDSKVAGHWGAGKTVEIVLRNFFWPGMEAQIRQYVHERDSCQQNKPAGHRQNALLHPLELPSSPWSSISMDFITDLPKSEGCHTIWVVDNRFTKMAHFVGLKEKTAAAVARQFVNHIWKLHGLPDNIVSNRDTAFTSKFGKEVMNFLGIKQRMSTAFHPQTDGQTERVDQVLEAYLREYCGHEQDDWMELLPLAEYAYNNLFSTATGLSPFYANYGYHPRTNWPTAKAPRNPASELYTQWLQAVHQQAVERLQKTRERMAKYWDSDKRKGLNFQERDYIMLDGRHIKTKRACKKLDAKLYGPFRILSVGKRSVKLELRPRWRIHPTFHISLIEPYRDDPHRVSRVCPDMLTKDQIRGTSENW